MSEPNSENMGVDPRSAVVFGGDAERYDRARPSYPDTLVDDLVGLGGHRVLDVGCGTGKAGRLLAGRGLDVLGVDPDERMAVVARRHGLDVEVARFEEWDPQDRSFDLVASGQAWHWVDPRVGPEKAADLLAPGGSLAVFWNRPGYDPAVRAKLDEVYQRMAPEIALSSAELGTVGDERTLRDVAAIKGSGRFAAVKVRSYPWTCTYTRVQHLDQLRTHSDHILLPTRKRHSLLQAVGEVVAEAGGSITITYATILILASPERRP